MSYIIREYKTDRFGLSLDSYEEAFDKCIALYLNSDKRRSFYVSGPNIPRGKK